ncbi:hypothetical protein [Mycobacterium paraterrae]|uniref:Mutator family transposase n=1 Tax=Mycobacterium paraterrae TaxID=577492 RepID=A0ABY3VPQ0_9MYCO|nr:hypothetical protein [Mycobacterium paraterrae]UMB70101.1 hypothetical protein MKK62_01760 [Mycobacterium paraterrae]
MTDNAYTSDMPHLLTLCERMLDHIEDRADALKFGTRCVNTSAITQAGSVKPSSSWPRFQTNQNERIAPSMLRFVVAENIFRAAEYARRRNRAVAKILRRKRAVAANGSADLLAAWTPARETMNLLDRFLDDETNAESLEALRRHLERNSHCAGGTRR